MQYEVIPNESVGPVHLGMDKSAVAELLGPPIQADREPWTWSGQSAFEIQFTDSRVDHISGATYDTQYVYLINGVSLNGRWGDVRRRIESTGYQLAVREASGRTLEIEGQGVLLWTNLGDIVDEVAVVSPDRLHRLFPTMP